MSSIPQNPLSAPRRRLGPAVALATVALLLAGCGGGDDGTTTKRTASAAKNAGVGQVQTALADDVPAKSAAFVEVTIRPQGEAKAAVDELSGLAGVADPGGAIVKGLDLDDQMDGGGTFQKDVLPYLGDHVAAFALVGASSAKAKANGALVAEVRDADALRKALVPKIDKDGTTKVQVDGQTIYRKADDKLAAWFGDSLFAIGTEDAVRATIATSKGQALADNDRFTDALQQIRGTDALGVAWVDLQQADTLNALIQTASSSKNAEALQDLTQKGPGSLSDRLGTDGDALQKLARQGTIPEVDAAFAVALQAQPGQIKLEAGGTGSADDAPKDDAGDAAKALADLPSGSWLAVGAGLSGLSTAGTEGSSPKDLLALITRLTGSTFSPELSTALGKIQTVALAVRGDSLTSIGGAVVLRTADAAAAKALMDQATELGRKQLGLRFTSHAVPGADAGVTAPLGSFPAQLVVGTKGARVAIGLGSDAVAGALGNGSRLGADPAYAQAKQLLGGDAPVLVINPQPIAALVGSLPLDDPSQAVQAIQRIKMIAASTARTSPTTWRGTFAVQYDAKPAASPDGGSQAP